MSNLWLISDTHFGHDKEFIYLPRNFQTVEEMNEAIVERWNANVKEQDTVYLLGDVAMGSIDNINFLTRLKGQIYLAIGNHDTETRLNAIKQLPNIKSIEFGYRLKDGRITFLLTHYPQLTGNYDKSHTYSIHGHTHLSNPFTPDFDLMYNVNCESQNCTPVAFEDMRQQIKEKRINFNMVKNN